MAVIREGLVTMLLAILLQIVIHVAEGVPLHPSSGGYFLTTNSVDNSAVGDDPFPNVFRDMVDSGYDLSAVESIQEKILPYFQNHKYAMAMVDGVPSFILPGNVLQGELLGEEDAGKYVVLATPELAKDGDSYSQQHHRQKRFITPYKLRLIAIPVSIFNYLGFLPVKVPGLPYHEDLPPPEYTYYNTIYDLHPDKRTKYFKF